MTFNSVLQLALYLAAVLVLAKPLGRYMARIFEERPESENTIWGWFEQAIYRVSGVDPRREMTWKRYCLSVFMFNGMGLAALYAMLRLQGMLPLNPEGFGSCSPHLAFNTAASFATNTNWQSYGGETTLSYCSQMLGLGVQNFLSAATGIAVLVALIRGLTRCSADTIGNFWVDLLRSTLYILLPLSLALAVFLVSQGVVQSLRPYLQVALVQPVSSEEGERVVSQTLPLGPAASQVAIKQLGTNGGGFFGANSCHPFENPTPLSNFLEMLAILLIPAALCHTYGRLVSDPREGRIILAAMLAVFVPLAIGAIWAEQAGNPQLAKMGADQRALDTQAGGNLEGKETRFGIANSAIWATATTAASNGSVNSMHDSFTPLGGLISIWLIQLGEIIFGGVGSGLYGMLMFLVVAVFIAGLMVGRTPEYLGKKIEAFEMKMASLVILIPPIVVLVGSAVAVLGPGITYRDESGQVGEQLNNPAAHGFSEVLYAFSSAGNNNGSAFAGLTTNEPFYNAALGVAMLIARYWLIIPTLAVAGSMARKKHTPPGAGTLRTHTPLFAIILVGIVLLVGALNFVPALALGPIVEHLQMISR